MKRLIVSLLAVTGAVWTLSAWNAVGHAAIAQIAENHVRNHTLDMLGKYLHGESITEVASYPDKYYYEWTRDLGWEISNPTILRRKPSELDVEPFNIEPWCHSFTVDDNCQVYRHNREGDEYIRNAVMDADYLINRLKNEIGQMSDEEIRRAISLVVHLVGDIHCPMHTLYVPSAPTGGKYSIYLESKKVNIHTFWDTTIFQKLNRDWSYSNYADAADIASKEQIRQITEGDIFSWASRSARDVKPAHTLTPSQDVSIDYPESMRWLLYQQLRNAGYRLAATLDYIFADDNEKKDLSIIPGCSRKSK